MLPLAYPPLAPDTRLWVLPHPHSSTPVYFAVGDAHALYELVVVRADKPNTRSWFVAPYAPQGASGGQGEVLSDGALRILTPIDPAFVLLGILGDDPHAFDTRQYRPLDDLADLAAERHAARRAEAGGGARPWPDLVPFLTLPGNAPHLARICDTQAEVAAADGYVYRLSLAKISALLDTKHQRLADTAVHDRAPETLGRQVRKQLERPSAASAADVQAAQDEVARALLLAYLPPAVAQRWTAP